MSSFDFSRFQGGFSQFQVGFMVFQGSKLIFFIVPGGFLWLFKVPCSFFMVPSGFSFFKVSGCFSKVPGGF